jgi:hypothetical protein
MKKEKLDDSLRHKLSSYESAVPEHLWEGVARRLEQNGKVKPAFWLLHRAKILGIAASLVVGVVGYSLMSDKAEEDLLVAPSGIELLQNPALNKEILKEEEAIAFEADNLDKVSQKINQIPPTDNSDILISDGSYQNALSPSVVREEVVYNTKGKINSKDLAADKELYFVQYLPSKWSLLEPKINLFNKDQQCADFRETKNNFYWSMSYAQDFPIRKIETATNDLQDYVYLRESTESLLNAFSINMNLGIGLRNGLNIRSGLIYSRLNERFSHDLLSGEEIVIVQEVDSEGNLMVSDTTRNPIYTNVSNNNLYETLDIPLLFGYEKSNEKFGMGFYTGLLFNLVFSKSGTIISPVNQEDVVSLSSSGDAGDYFNKNLGLSYYASAVVSYRFTNRIQLKFEPYFRYTPKSISNSNYRVNQSYYMFGGQFGLRYYL